MRSDATTWLAVGGGGLAVSGLAAWVEETSSMSPGEAPALILIGLFLTGAGNLRPSSMVRWTAAGASLLAAIVAVNVGSSLQGVTEWRGDFVLAGLCALIVVSASVRMLAESRQASP